MPSQEIHSSFTLVSEALISISARIMIGQRMNTEASASQGLATFLYCRHDYLYGSLLNASNSRQHILFYIGSPTPHVQ